MLLTGIGLSNTFTWSNQNYYNAISNGFIEQSFQYLFRLSTIRTADKIVAIKDGQVVETGSHEELMDFKGLYYSLVLAQTNEHSDSLDSIEYPGTDSRNLTYSNQNVDLLYHKVSMFQSIFIFFINIEKSVEDGAANGENLDEVIDLSLPPLSSMVSSSTVLSVPAMPSSTRLNNFVTAESNAGQSASITQVIKKITRNHEDKIYLIDTSHKSVRLINFDIDNITSKKIFERKSAKII